MVSAVSLDTEHALWESGHVLIAGVDEVGRGAIAGPVSVGIAVLARCETWPEGLDDSKRLTALRRQSLLNALNAFGVARAVGHASASEIDQWGIIAALRLAASRAFASIAEQGCNPDIALLDGKHDWLTLPPDDLFGGSNPVEGPIPATVKTIIGGDRQCAVIAAGSVLAKVERDALMVAAAQELPHYNWESNKGYGAQIHRDGIRQYGAVPGWHRLSWNLLGTS